MNQNGTINKVILVGEISHFPSRHKNDNDKSMLCFTLTTRERYKQNGVHTEHAEQHSIKLHDNNWGYDFKPGQWVHIEGTIKTSTFIDEGKVKRFKCEVIATKICPLKLIHEG